MFCGSIRLKLFNGHGKEVLLGPRIQVISDTLGTRLLTLKARCITYWLWFTPSLSTESDNNSEWSHQWHCRSDVSVPVRWRPLADECWGPQMQCYLEKFSFGHCDILLITQFIVFFTRGIHAPICSDAWAKFPSDNFLLHWISRFERHLMNASSLRIWFFKDFHILNI